MGDVDGVTVIDIQQRVFEFDHSRFGKGEASGEGVNDPNIRIARRPKTEDTSIAQVSGEELQPIGPVEALVRFVQ